MLYEKNDYLSTMRKVQTLFLLGAIWMLTACPPMKNEPKSLDSALDSSEASSILSANNMNRDTLFDKVYGMLLGAAIGDAMGAPTEMWTRHQMQLEYGHIQGLDSMVREPSGEGTWDYNLPAGSTTDDTRWKALLVDFLTGSQKKNKSYQSELDPKDFAVFLMNHYEEDIKALKSVESYYPAPFEAQMRKVNWLQEWAIVAKAYNEGDIDQYAAALHKFYGGEMVCGGMLFAPTVGAYYPSDPARAYEQSYRINIFDIGYAQDIGGLTAAMVAAAMDAQAKPSDILSVIRDIDPKGYFKSRLVGRTAYKVYQEALQLVYEAKLAKVGDIEPKDFPLAMAYKSPEDSLYYVQLAKAYQLLDQKLERYPFHPAEIHLVNLSALLFTDFDFQKALEFVINFGRDNDTTAAVTGSILGAYHGASALPQQLVQTVTSANLALGIDLKGMAERMTRVIVES